MTELSGQVQSWNQTSYPPPGVSLATKGRELMKNGVRMGASASSLWPHRGYLSGTYTVLGAAGLMLPGWGGNGRGPGPMVHHPYLASGIVGSTRFVFSLVKQKTCL